jgi:hypothetical protein
MTASLRRRPLNLETLEDRLAPAVFNVNSLADVLQPPAGVVTLRSAIQAANATPGGNTINLTLAGTYKLSAGELNISVGRGDLMVANSSGGSVTVDGGGFHRVFYVLDEATNFAVTFDGITITGGNALPVGGDDGSGGGILAIGGASVVLNNVVLNDNAATAGGGGIAMKSPALNPGPGMEFATIASSGSLTIHASTVSHNYAGQAGGGIETESAGHVAIDTGTVIDYNTGVNQGGGIFAEAGTIAITSCFIHDNLSGGIGGGYSDMSDEATVAISNTLFFDNAAAQDGGGIYAAGPSLTITNSVFEGNTSQGNGGGVFVDVAGTAQVTNTVFRNNRAVNGGGLEDDTNFPEDSGNFLNVTSCTLENNFAVGDAIANTGNGGGIDMEGGIPDQLYVEDTLVLNNLAANNGGGISAVAGGLLVITNSQLTGNSASSKGGGVFYLGTGPSTILFGFASSGTTFSDNRASSGGGLDYESVGTVAALSDSGLNNDTFVGNFASADGGAIRDAGTGDLALIDLTITDNRAGTNGGGVALVGGHFILSFGNTIVSGNTAGQSGPDIFTPVGFSVTDDGGNLIGSIQGTSGFGAGTLVGIDPLLGPLEDNGGQLSGAPSAQRIIQTEALLPGSPAIGKGTPLGSIVADERGFFRSNNGRLPVSIGAYEPQLSATASANQVFVENLYEVLLGRTTDPVGLAAWTALLNQGTLPSSIVQAIENSDEYRADQVQQLYQRYLNRQPEAGGLQFWISDLANGATIEQVASAIVGSPEYFQLHGNNNILFLDTLYEDALTRPPDPVGIDAFSQALADGATRSAVAALVFGSAEYQTNVIEADYEALLGRPVDQGSLALLLEELGSGTTEQQIVAAILGSPEAFHNRT